MKKYCALMMAISFCLQITYGQKKTGNTELISPFIHYQNLSSPALTIWLKNDGIVDGPQFNASLEYPIGSGKSPLFSSGFGVSGYINDSLQVSWQFSSARTTDWQPGNINSNYVSDPSSPRNKVYKYRKGDAAATNPDVMEWPTDIGAPFIDLNGNGVYEPNSGELPEIFGTQMLWLTVNDGIAREAREWKTTPIGIELQLSIFMVEKGSPEFDNTVFFLYKLIHKGKQQLKKAVFSLVSDPDLGWATDDLVGYDTTRSLSYCFNSTNYDQNYLTSPPALGITLLTGPRIFSGNNKDSLFFGNKWVWGYRNGQVLSFIRTLNTPTGFHDPANAWEARNLQLGLQPDSSSIDPLTEGVGGVMADIPEKMFPGFPEKNEGWRDSNAADRRILLSTEPFDFAPGDTQFVFSAILIGHGGSNLESINALRVISDTLKRNLVDLRYPTINRYKTGSLKLKLIDQTGSGIQRASLAIVKKGDSFWEKRYYNFSETAYESVFPSGDYSVQAIGYDDVWGKIPDTANFTISIPPDGILDTAIQLKQVPGYEDRFYGNFAHIWKTGFPGDTTSVSPTVSWQVQNGFFGWTSTVPKGRYTTEIAADLTHYVYPVFSIEGNYRLNGAGDTLFIYGSGDNGKSWTKLNSWQGEWPAKWVFRSYDLDLFLTITDTVRIRFVLVKNSNSLTQMKLDNFKISHYGYTSVESESPLSDGFRLLAAYPNPFNPVTTLKWIQPVAGEAEIGVYSVLGQEVKRQKAPHFPSGEASVSLNFSGLPSGVYFIRLELGRTLKTTGKVLLVK